MSGYPEWAIKKVKKDRSRPKPNHATSKNPTKTEKSKGFVVIPHVEGLSERVAKVFRKHDISTAMTPRDETPQDFSQYASTSQGQTPPPSKKARPSIKYRVLIAPNLTLVRLDFRHSSPRTSKGSGEI